MGGGAIESPELRCKVREEFRRPTNSESIIESAIVEPFVDQPSNDK